MQVKQTRLNTFLNVIPNAYRLIGDSRNLNKVLPVPQQQ